MCNSATTFSVGLLLQLADVACCIENFKADIMAEEFRQELLRRTSVQAVNLDESRRPSYTPVNESFRKLAVD